MAVLLVPVLDEGQHLVPQILYGGEADVLQATSVQDREENLHLIDPGSVEGCVTKLEPSAMSLVKFRPPK